MEPNRIVSREDWLAERRALLEEEKELTRLQDRVSARRRELPWVRVDKEYVFDTAEGPKTLAGLFEGRSQLIVYHFMFAPDWDQGCLGCSFFADHIDGPNLHLAHHDVTLIAASRAPIADIEAYRRRMGWRFTWVSSLGSDFNYDYHVSFTEDEVAAGRGFYNFEATEIPVSELPGISVFATDGAGAVFHTYSAYARGDERGLGAYMFLDLTPKGRDETGPNFNLTDWVRRHDEYDPATGPVAARAATG